MEQTAAWYRRWAEVEAHGSSPIYERLALAVAYHSDLLTLLESVDTDKRQPNLFFAALRWFDVPVEDPHASLAWAVKHWESVAELLRRRRTQTNEVARCAVLLPALAQLPEPLAVLEVGASAGLCLLYEQWRYHYTGSGVDHWVGRPDSLVQLHCRVTGPAPLPQRVPTINWRLGLDLHPVDLTDTEARRWLQCLVWPEHHDRFRVLAAALEVAARQPPPIAQGDLVTDLAALLDDLPGDATPVVIHAATLTYLEESHRQAFEELLSARGVHRLGAEGTDVLPDLARHIPAGRDAARHFMVSLDDQALALAHPHGRSLDWISS